MVGANRVLGVGFKLPNFKINCVYDSLWQISWGRIRVCRKKIVFELL